MTASPRMISNVHQGRILAAKGFTKKNPAAIAMKAFPHQTLDLYELRKRTSAGSGDWEGAARWLEGAGQKKTLLMG